MIYLDSFHLHYILILDIFLSGYRPPIQAEDPRALSISQLQFIFLASHSLVLSFESYTLTPENQSLLASSHASILRPSEPSKNLVHLVKQGTPAISDRRTSPLILPDQSDETNVHSSKNNLHHNNTHHNHNRP